MEDQQLHSKKTKIENGVTSYLDDNPCCDDKLPKNQNQVLSRSSGEEAAAAPKRIVSVQTTSVTSLVSDGCHWRKYGQKMTRNSTLPRSYYKCAMVPGCPVKKQVQRCAEDPTIVKTTYEGEHTHPLCMYTSNFVAENQFIPVSVAIPKISTSSTSPTITLDLTDNRPNPELHLQSTDLAAGSLQNSTSLPGNNVQLLAQNRNSSVVQEFLASIKEDPNFTAALAVAIAGSLLNLGTPIQGMPKSSRATQCIDGSTQEAFK